MANLSNINNKFLVTTGGNVGVGTTSPVAKFEVTDGSSSITLQEYSNGAAIFLDGVNGDFIGGDYFHILADGNSYLGLGGYGGGTTPLNITNAGNVGIGTTSMQGRLTVVGATQTIVADLDANTSVGLSVMGVSSTNFNAITLGSANSTNNCGVIRFKYVGAGSTNNYMGLGFYANDDILTVKGNGRVGINQNNPESELHVEGAGGDGAAILRLIAATTGGTFNWASSTVYPNIGTGKTIINLFGHAQSYNNQAYIGFKYAGSGSTSNQLTFGFYGNDFLVNLLANGNFGIGTQSPSSKLHSVVTTAGDSALKLQDDTGSVFDFQCGISGVTGDALLIKDTTLSYDYLTLRGGNVGIGTTSPNHKLDIYSNENVPLRIHRPNNANLDSSGAWGIGFSTRSDSVTSTTDTRAGIFSYYNGNLFFATNTSSIVADPDASARMTITSAGYVGIGTTTPGNTLDVAGDTDITGQLVVSHNANYVAKFVNTATSMSNNNYTLMVDSSSHTSNLSTAGAMSVDVNSGRAFTITGQGRIGIGTSSPNTKLEVQGGAGSGTHAHATFTATANRGLKISTTSSPHGQNSGTVLYDAQDTEGYSEQHWLLGGNTKMVLNKDGNLGINTTSPSYKLQVIGTAYINETLYVNGDTTIDANLDVTSGGRVKVSGSNTDQYYFEGQRNGVGVTYRLYDNANNIYHDSYTSQVFRLNQNGGSGGNLIITGGNVGINATSPSDKLEVTTSASQYTGRFDYTGSSGGAYGCLKLRISANTSPSFIDLFYDGFSTNPLSPVGAIVTTGSAVLYSSFSDYRLKENVADLTGALDRVNSLQPKTFNYINRPETTNEGFLAHELQEIVPQAVSGTKDGVDEDGNPKYQGVDNAHLVPLLVGAIKELKAEIELLKNK